MLGLEAVEDPLDLGLVARVEARGDPAGRPASRPRACPSAPVSTRPPTRRTRAPAPSPRRPRGRRGPSRRRSSRAGRPRRARAGSPREVDDAVRTAEERRELARRDVRSSPLDLRQLDAPAGAARARAPTPPAARRQARRGDWCRRCRSRRRRRRASGAHAQLVDEGEERLRVRRVARPRRAPRPSRSARARVRAISSTPVVVELVLAQREQLRDEHVLGAHDGHSHGVHLEHLGARRATRRRRDRRVGSKIRSTSTSPSQAFVAASPPAASPGGSRASASACSARSASSGLTKKSTSCSVSGPPRAQIARPPPSANGIVRLAQRGCRPA